MTDKQFKELFEQGKKLVANSKDPVHNGTHIERVLEFSQKIIDKLPKKDVASLDKKILNLAIVWHDISFVFYKPGFKQFLFENIRGKEIAKKYFKQANLPADEIKLIASVIYYHTFNIFHCLNKRRSLYHQIVQDADTMDSFSPIFSIDRVIKTKKTADDSSLIFYKFVYYILRPLFYNWIIRQKGWIYNLPHIIHKLEAEHKK